MVNILPNKLQGTVYLKLLPDSIQPQTFMIENVRQLKQRIISPVNILL